MITFFSNIKKELLMLIRDWVGLIFLFFMPVGLVILMTFLQDSTMRKLEKERIDIALINEDESIVGKAVLKGLEMSEAFNVVSVYKGDTLDVKKAKVLVEDGVFDFALLIPQKATRHLKAIVKNEIIKQKPNGFAFPVDTDQLENVDFQIYFNPVIKGSFRQAISSRIHELIAKVQTQIIFKSYTKFVKSLNKHENNDDFPIHKVTVKETKLGSFTNKPLPNSTQHNVPAWTVFAIFFIVIPLSGQIITERTEGTLMRLKTLPVLFVNFLSSRIVVYSFISVFQASLLLLLGYFVLPLMGLPILDFKGQVFDILLFTFVIGLAATSYGVLIAVIAKTQHQAAIFGSVSIVILAAVGGVFVPTYVMSEAMQVFSSVSPLNWALSGYYDIFLNKAGFENIYPEVIKLLMIFVVCLSLANYFDQPEK